MRASYVLGLILLVVAGFSYSNSAHCDETADAEQDRVMKAELAIRATLAELDTCFVYEDMPIRDIVEDLKAKWEIPILFDLKAFEESNLTPDQPVSINVPKVTRKSGLKLMLEPFELTYVIRDEVLVVTTIEHAKRNLPVRFYDVRDLISAIEEDELKRRKLFGDPVTVPTKDASTAPVQPNTNSPTPSDVKPQFGGLVRSSTPEVTTMNVPVPTRFSASDTVQILITQTLSPDAWEEAGGPGRVSVVAGVMVVCQTAEVHEQIESMLARMRSILRNKPVSHNANAK